MIALISFLFPIILQNLLETVADEGGKRLAESSKDDRTFKILFGSPEAVGALSVIALATFLYFVHIWDGPDLLEAIVGSISGMLGAKFWRGIRQGQAEHEASKRNNKITEMPPGPEEELPQSDSDSPSVTEPLGELNEPASIKFAEEVESNLMENSIVIEEETPQSATHNSDTPEPILSQTGSRVQILEVNKIEEYVDIRNVGKTDIDLEGWVLVSETGPQKCRLAGNLAAGATLRIYALGKDADKGGFNCGFSRPIWNNSEYDPAVLYDNLETEIDRK